MNLNLWRSSPSSLYNSRSRIEFSRSRAVFATVTVQSVAFMPDFLPENVMHVRSRASRAPNSHRHYIISGAYSTYLDGPVWLPRKRRKRVGNEVLCFDFSDVWFPGKWNTRRESVKVLCDTQLSCFFRYWELNKREWCDVNFVSVTLFFFRFSASKRKQVLPFSEGPTKGNGKEVHFLKKLKTSSH